MRKTGSALINEMVGPAGSISEGVFSRAKSGEEEEFRSLPACPAGLLLEDCAWAATGAKHASRQKTAVERKAEDGSALSVMKNPV
jgi:hypothetical protein